ncbi:hypothetical protein ACFW9O_25135 [Streptomyces sp. NPDC059499]|uniref:hypothetical protein n=1 Tax=Streptomyces sp. NPDC059499 TaxID=3346852 RepID=UPI0036889591
MTTAAAPRRPSPADMARKATAADRALAAPGTPPPGIAFRALYERAILASNMLPHPKFVAIALATHADAAGQITQQPRLFGLIHLTGIHAGQVVVALNVLKQRGWIRQVQPSAPYDTADLLLTIPAPILARLRKPTA